MALPVPKNTNLLGEGTYSRVYADDNGNAIKCIKYENLESAIREVLFLKYLSPHPNIVPLIGFNFDEEEIKLEMKKFPTNLDKEIRANKLIVPDRVFNIAHNIANALAFIHSRGIIHCDIKPENVLLDEDTAVICDFGISTVSSEKYNRGKIQTCTYRAPEINSDKNKLQYRDKIDIWSFGCILFEMVTGTKFIKYQENIDDSSIYISTALELPILDTRKDRLRLIRDSPLAYIKGIVSKRIRALITGDYYKYLGEEFILIISMCLHPITSKRIDAQVALNLIGGIANKHRHDKPVTYPNKPITVTGGKDYDEMSILVNMSEDLIKFCSRTVIDFAQGIYDKMGINEPIMQSCCLYIAACVFSSNIALIRNILHKNHDKKEISKVCALILNGVYDSF